MVFVIELVFLLQAFRLLSSFVTSESIQLILKVLKPKQPAGELLEDGSEGEEEGGEEGGDNEEDGNDEEEEDMKESDGEDDGEDTEGEGAEEEIGGVDKEFADEVRRALGAAAVTSDGEVSF